MKHTSLDTDCEVQQPPIHNEEALVQFCRVATIEQAQQIIDAFGGIEMIDGNIEKHTVAARMFPIIVAGTKEQYKQFKSFINSNHS